MMQVAGSRNTETVVRWGLERLWELASVWARWIFVSQQDGLCEGARYDTSASSSLGVWASMRRAFHDITIIGSGGFGRLFLILTFAAAHDPADTR